LHSYFSQYEVLRAVVESLTVPDPAIELENHWRSSSILVIAIIGITYLLFTEKQANRELIQEFQLDKEDSSSSR